jgi:histidinol phosphatase-like enzyme (inositol monophosphatase family)
MGELVDLNNIDTIITPLITYAGEIALDRFRSPLAIEDKGRGQGYDPVTEVDRLAEAYLRDRLSARFPDHQIVGEEHGATGSVGRVRWVIDPIDGTKAYVSGVPLWGVLLGLVVDGVPIAGWARLPYLDETFAAVDGIAWFEKGGDRRPLKASSTTDLSAATMYSTHPGMFVAQSERAAFGALASKVRLQRFGGDCYSYCLLALGLIDLVVEASLHPYDIVPLVPIVEAAGGTITGPDRELPAAGGLVIAAGSAALHAQALDVVAGYSRPPEEVPRHD